MEFATKDGKKLETPQGEFTAVVMTEGDEKEAAIETLKTDEAEMRSRSSQGFGQRRGGGGRHGGRGGRGGGGGNRNPFSKNKGGPKRDNSFVDSSTDVKQEVSDAPQAKHTKFDSDHDDD